MDPVASGGSDGGPPTGRLAGNALASFLDPQRVVFVSGSPSQRDVLLQLAELTGSDWTIAQRAYFLKALFDREAVTTTAIGGGIAVPHARLTHLDRCRVTIGLAPGGVEWLARDSQPVRLIVLIAARENDRAEHLRLLAAVASRLNDLARRERVIQATSAEEALTELAGSG